MSSDPTGGIGDHAGTQRPATSLILVAGPSGAGKDTLIRMAVDLLGAGARLHVARRTVTRPPNAFEDHASLERGEFERLERDGYFALSWRAHGLAYGIPFSELDRHNALVVASVSRTAIEAGRALAPDTNVVLITAPPEVLAKRIATRGREASIDSRLARINLDEELAAQVDLKIVNAGTPEQGATLLADFMRARLPA